MIEVDFLMPGEKIKHLRKVLGLNQQEISSENVSRNYISMIESGSRSLTKETAVRIAASFNKAASERGIQMQVDAECLMTSPQEEARAYVSEKIQETDTVSEFDSILNCINKYELKDILSTAYEKLANLYYDATDFNKAFTYYFEAFDAAQISGQEERFSYILNKLGKCKLRTVAYMEALIFLNKGYAYALLNKDDANRKNIAFNMALANKKLKNYNDTIHFIDEYLSLCDKEKEHSDYLNARLIKANCYLENLEYETALTMYNELLQNIIENEESVRGIIVHNIALTYYHLEQYEKALYYFNKSEDIRQSSDKIRLSHVLIDKSLVYIKQNNMEQAVELLERGITEAKIYNDSEYLLTAYSMIEDIYLDQKEYEKLEQVYLELLRIEETRGFQEGVFMIYGKLARLQLLQNNIERANLYLEIFSNRHNK